FALLTGRSNPLRPIAKEGRPLSRQGYVLQPLNPLATSPGNMWSVAAAASTGEVAWFWAAPSAVGRFRTNAGALRDRRKSKGEASSSSYFPLGTAGAYRRRFSGGSSYNAEMRIACLGGGPGGLCFALLAKKVMPAWSVEVWDRNPPGATYGFGVVFSDEAMEAIRRADADIHDAIVRERASW